MTTLVNLVIGEYNPVWPGIIRNNRLSNLFKHIDLRYQLVIDLVWKMFVKIELAALENIVADKTTHNLSLQNFYLCKSYVVCSNRSLLWEECWSLMG